MRLLTIRHLKEKDLALSRCGPAAVLQIHLLCSRTLHKLSKLREGAWPHRALKVSITLISSTSHLAQLTSTRMLMKMTSRELTQVKVSNQWCQVLFRLRLSLRCKLSDSCLTLMLSSAYLQTKSPTNPRPKWMSLSTNKTTSIRPISLAKPITSKY